MQKKHADTPTTRVCGIYRTSLGSYENLIRSDLFIYSSRRSAEQKCENRGSLKKILSSILVSRASINIFFNQNDHNLVESIKTHIEALKSLKNQVRPPKYSYERGPSSLMLSPSLVLNGFLRRTTFK